MKISLINPPQKLANRDVPLISPPLGLLYVAAILEGKGYDVGVDDFLVSRKINIKKIDNNFVHVGLSWKRIKENLRKNKAVIFGVTNQFTNHLNYTLELCRLIKKINREAIVVVGGPHSSSFPEDILKNDFVDYVITGEGEYAFANLVEKISKNKSLAEIKGLAYREEGRIVINKLELIEDLDRLPFPAYHLINLENYFRAYKKGYEARPDCSYSIKVISMITSRGCPFNCIFCSIHPHMGRKFRAHSAEYVIKHIKFLKEKYNIEHMHFEDDNLTFNIKRFEEILDRLIKEDIKIKWDTPNGVRADRLNFNLLKKAKKSGCTRLKVAAESGDQEILDNVIRKNLNLEEIENVASICKKLKIPLGSFFIIGFPGEKLENIDNTFDFAYYLFKKYDLTPQFNLARPTVGTELYEICKKNNYIKYPSGIYLQFSNAYIETEDFNVTQLRHRLNIFYRKLAPLYVLRFLSDPYFVYKVLKSTNYRKIKTVIKAGLNYLF